LVDTQSNIEVAAPVVEVADKIISLLTETLDISKDYAENIIQFRKTHNLSNNEMVLLNLISLESLYGGFGIPNLSLVALFSLMSFSFLY
jgi:hypothetical protein